jgi:hypothetical protein
VEVHVTPSVRVNSIGSTGWVRSRAWITGSSH